MYKDLNILIEVLVPLLQDYNTKYTYSICFLSFKKMANEYFVEDFLVNFLNKLNKYNNKMFFCDKFS